MLAFPSAPASRGIGLRVATIAALLLLLVAFSSIVWTPHPVDAINVAATMQGVSAAHWLGTDQLGRDVLSLLMKGMLTSFVVAAMGVALGAAIGLPLGLATYSFAPGRPASSATLVFALPALVVAIVAATLFGASALTASLAIATFNIGAFAATAQRGLHALRTQGYADAARMAGFGSLEILRRHLLPNLRDVFLAQAALQLGLGVLAEASLSFVGLGTQSTASSLGLMLRDAQASALLQPLLALAPGVAIIAVVVALNSLAAGLEQRLDGRLRQAGVVDALA